MGRRPRSNRSGTGTNSQPATSLHNQQNHQQRQQRQQQQQSQQQQQRQQQQQNDQLTNTISPFVGSPFLIPMMMMMNGGGSNTVNQPQFPHQQQQQQRKNKKKKQGKSFISDGKTNSQITSFPTSIGNFMPPVVASRDPLSFAIASRRLQEKSKNKSQTPNDTSASTSISSTNVKQSIKTKKANNISKPCKKPRQPQVFWSPANYFYYPTDKESNNEQGRSDIDDTTTMLETFDFNVDPNTMLTLDTNAIITRFSALPSTVLFEKDLRERMSTIILLDIPENWSTLMVYKVLCIVDINLIGCRLIRKPNLERTNCGIATMSNAPCVIRTANSISKELNTDTTLKLYPTHIILLMWARNDIINIDQKLPLVSKLLDLPLIKELSFPGDKMKLLLNLQKVTYFVKDLENLLHDFIKKTKMDSTLLLDFLAKRLNHIALNITSCINLSLHPMDNPLPDDKYDEESEEEEEEEEEEKVWRKRLPLNKRRFQSGIHSNGIQQGIGTNRTVFNVDEHLFHYFEVVSGGSYDFFNPIDVQRDPDMLKTIGGEGIDSSSWKIVEINQDKYSFGIDNCRFKCTKFPISTSLLTDPDMDSESVAQVAEEIRRFRNENLMNDLIDIDEQIRDIEKLLALENSKMSIDSALALTDDIVKLLESNNETMDNDESKRFISKETKRRRSEDIEDEETSIQGNDQEHKKFSQDTKIRLSEIFKTYENRNDN